MATAADKLATLLEAAEEKIADLETQLEAIDDQVQWSWTRHEELSKEQTLPVPRLEIVLDDVAAYNRTWIYRMIYRHLLDHCVAVPLGRTTQSGGGTIAIENFESHVPFRDGVHIRSDAKQFGWPMYAVCGDRVVELFPLLEKIK